MQPGIVCANDGARDRMGVVAVAWIESSEPGGGPDTTIEKGLKMDPEAKKFIEELKAHAVAETAEWMADSNHSQEPDRKPEDHIAWQAAAWLQAIFDPENQPSQYGTCLADQVI